VALAGSDLLGGSSEAKTLAVASLTEMARLAQASGQEAIALDHVEQALVHDPKNRELRKKSSALRKSISTSIYKDGLALMKTDLAGAIEKFELASTYDPKNLSIKRRLNQAVTLQQNLKKIRQQ